MSRPRRIPVTPLGEVVSLLRCVRCAGRLRVESAGSDGERLVCTDCGYTCAVRDGIPRFAETPADDLACRTQASSGYEWTHFDDWTASGTTNFQVISSALIFVDCEMRQCWTPGAVWAGTRSSLPHTAGAWSRWISA